MSDAEMNVAIAEWCGWKRVLTESLILQIRSEVWIRPGDTEDHGFRPPYYVDDLNAVHEAEKRLDRKRNGEIAQYCANLWRAMDSSPEAEIGTIHATARQRSEALLRTLGLWKD